MFYFTAGIIRDKVPPSSILSEDQSFQSGISYSSVPSQPLQSQVSCPQTQNDQTQQQQLLVVSFAWINLILRSYLSLFHIANAIFCGVKVKPPMQGVPSEVLLVAPNVQSAPAVSPQVCYSICCIFKSVTYSIIHNRFNGELFDKPSLSFLRFGVIFRGFDYLALN